MTVAVKVPDDRELVLAALAAGQKYLLRVAARTQSRGTELLAKAAREARVHVAIGL